MLNGAVCFSIMLFSFFSRTLEPRLSKKNQSVKKTAFGKDYPVLTKKQKEHIQQSVYDYKPTKSELESLAPDHVQKLAKKFFDTMAEIEGEKKPKIRNSNLLNVYQNLTSSTAHAIAYFKGIQFPPESFSEKKQLTTSQQYSLCHEVAHQYLEHCGNRYTIEAEQQEFEAEDLCIRTLYKMKKFDAIQNKLFLRNISSISRDFPTNSFAPYIFGALNGFAKIREKEAKTKNKALVNNICKSVSVVPQSFGDIRKHLRANKGGNHYLRIFLPCVKLPITSYILFKVVTPDLISSFKNKKKNKIIKTIGIIISLFASCTCAKMIYSACSNLKHIFLTNRRIRTWKPKTYKEYTEWKKKNKIIIERLTS